MDKLTGAKKCKKIVSLSVLVTLGALSINNIQKKDIEPNTIIEQPVSDTETKVEGYIYIPMNSQSAPQPVSYTQEKVATTNTYSKNDINYELDRIVTFYTDIKDVKQLGNMFAGHLMYGEIMEFLNQEDGKTTYAIYKQIAKGLSKH